MTLKENLRIQIFYRGKNKADGVPVGAIIGVVCLFIFLAVLAVLLKCFRRKLKSVYCITFSFVLQN